MAHGERLAIFAITNLLPRQVECMTAVENKEGAAWLSVTFSSPSFGVAPHQGSIFTVAKPNVGSWRVAILYQNKPTVIDELGLSMRRLLYRLRLNGVAKRVPTEKLNYYSIFGSEMTD